MNRNNLHATATVVTMPKRLFTLLSVLTVLFAIILQAGPAAAYTNGKATFRWQANPPKEKVSGYRLHYGSTSRFNANGKPKSNFSYDYSIDLSKSVRCNNRSYKNDCETLAPNELSCVNLDSSAPTCTLSSLQGTVHLAMTAYSSTRESGFTKEIKLAPAKKKPVIIPTAIQLLLLK